MTARDHNKLLSIFFFIQGGLILLAGIFIVLAYGIMGGAMAATSSRGDEQLVGGIFVVISVVMGLVMFIFAGLYLFAGLKIRKEQKIGRTLGIIGSILALFSFPLGTALGVYGLWFLFGEGRALYESGQAGMNYTAPPPPNSWQ
jgi:hypothetical protein